MTTARELLQEAMDYLVESHKIEARYLAADIKAFLAQPEPEPVVHVEMRDGRIVSMFGKLPDGRHALYAAQPEQDGGVLEGTNRTTSGAIGQP